LWYIFVIFDLQFERRGEMPRLSCRESEQVLLRAIKDRGGMTLTEVLTFEDGEDIWFGPVTTGLDLLEKHEKLGIIKFDPVDGKYKVIGPQ
jgi:hypothetical protein